MRGDAGSTLSGRGLALAVLPGALALARRLGLWAVFWELEYNSYAPELLAASLLICLAGFATQRRFPVWSFPALGIALFYIAAAACFFPMLWPIWLGIVVLVVIVSCRRQTPLMPWESWLALLVALGTALAFASIFLPAPECCNESSVGGWPTQPLLMLSALLSVHAVAVGALYAPRHGLVAGLVVAGSIAGQWTTTIMPFSRGLGAIHAPLFFLIVTPIAAARLRSVWARAAGLLVPAVLAVAWEVRGYALDPHPMARMGALILIAISLAPLAAAVVIYAWLGPRAGRATQPGV